MQENTTSRPRARTLGFAALASVVGVGALIIGFAAGGSSVAGVPLALAAGSPSPSASTWNGPDGRGGPGGWMFDGMGPGGRGNGMMRGFGRGADYGYITITAISGSKLSLKTDNGWTRTIDATGATITKDGSTVALSALAVGDKIRFSETRNSDGTYAINAIAVIQPSVEGTVSSVAGDTVTLTLRDGSSQKVVLTAGTTYQLGRQSATRGAIVTGAEILARGTLASDGTLTASSVEVAPATAFGTVKSKDASSITLTLRDGSTLTLKVSSSTTYRVAGVSSASLSDVAVGAVVMASGTRNSDGSISAMLVRAGAAGRDGGPGLGGWGGRGGMHGGMPGMPYASPAPSTAPSGYSG